MKKRKPANVIDKHFNKAGNSQTKPSGDLNDVSSQGFADDDEHPSLQITEDTSRSTDIMNSDGAANVPDVSSHDNEGDSLGFAVESTGDFDDTASQVTADNEHEASILLNIMFHAPMGRFQLDLIIILPIFPPSSHPAVGWDDGGKIAKIIN